MKNSMRSTGYPALIAVSLLAVGGVALAYPYPAHYVWMLGDAVAHNGDYRTSCFAVSTDGHVMDQGNNIPEAYCPQPKPKLAVFEWHLGDEIAHNGDLRTSCFVFDLNRRILSNGNNVDEWRCPSPKPDLAGYRWIFADDVAHNGDFRTLCYAVSPNSMCVLNQGNPVDPGYCVANHSESLWTARVCHSF